MWIVIVVSLATLTFLHITSLAFQLTRIFFNKMMNASHPSYDSPSKAFYFQITYTNDTLVLTVWTVKDVKGWFSTLKKDKGGFFNNFFSYFTQFADMRAKVWSHPSYDTPNDTLVLTVWTVKDVKGWFSTTKKDRGVFIDKKCVPQFPYFAQFVEDKSVI